MNAFHFPRVLFVLEFELDAPHQTGITAMLLVLALIAIKNRKTIIHENLMKTAIVL